MSAVTMSHIDALSARSIARLIARKGHRITYRVKGEPGIGKSSLLTMLQDMLGDGYEYVYIDAPTLNDGDLGMWMPERDARGMEFYVSGLVPRTGKPVVLMIDEIGKVDKFLRKMFARLMLNRVVGTYELPEGSIVFSTSNLATDGVGDTLLAHEQGRIIDVEMAKPTNREWVIWGASNGISATTLAWATMQPGAFDSYRTLTAEQLRDNGMIYNPSRPGAYLCPRTLAMADIVLEDRADFSRDEITVSLTGAVGRSAAESLMSFAMMEKDIVTPDVIMRDPETAPLPTGAGALLQSLFLAVPEVKTQTDLTAVVRYIERISNEAFKSVILSLLVEDHRTAGMAMQNAVIKAWYRDNHQIMR